jgi:hypothetical protein
VAVVLTVTFKYCEHASAEALVALTHSFVEYCAGVVTTVCVAHVEPAVAAAVELRLFITVSTGSALVTWFCRLNCATPAP